MRQITKQGIDLIKRFEGFEPEIYLDAAGLPTIGYGHLLRPGESKMFADGISEAAGEALLIKDVGIAERAVIRLIRVPLTSPDHADRTSADLHAVIPQMHLSATHRQLQMVRSASLGFLD